MATKKITLATVKSFIKANRAKLFISRRSRFDGMTDGITTLSDKAFHPVKDATPATHSNELGVPGAWFVGSSRDHFTAYEDDHYQGFEVSNCCGRFVLAVKKAIAEALDKGIHIHDGAGPWEIRKTEIPTPVESVARFGSDQWIVVRTATEQAAGVRIDWIWHYHADGRGVREYVRDVDAERLLAIKIRDALNAAAAVTK